MVAFALVLGGTALAAGTSAPLTKSSVTKLVKKLAPSLSVKNAKTVGGKQVKQFFASEAPSTATRTIASVDGVTLKASCSSIVDPSLSIENDSGQGGMLGGYSGAGGVGNLDDVEFGAAPVDLNNGSNGGGVLTVQLRTGVVVSVQWASTGTLGGSVTDCYFSGSVIAS